MAKFYSLHLFSPNLLMNIYYKLIYFEIICMLPSLITYSTVTELLEEEAIKICF